VLEAAAAPLGPGQVLEVVLTRLPLVDSPSSVELEEGDAETVAGDGDASYQLIAREIWDDLTDRERLVVGLIGPGVTVESVAAETGLSRSTAHRALISAREALAQHLRDRADQEAIAGALLELASTAQARGTNRASLAFTQGEEP
jgi:hypothetical protein